MPVYLSNASKLDIPQTTRYHVLWRGGCIGIYGQNAKDLVKREKGKDVEVKNTYQIFTTDKS